MNLLIVRFRALSADAIREANCVIDCCVVNVSNGNPMYWLYRLVAEGINRIQGQSAEQLGLQGLNRYFQYFDGKPYWRAPAGNTFWEPPSGAVRRFLPSGNWAWDVNGTHYRDTPGYEDL